MLRVPGATKSVLLGPTWVDRMVPQVPPEVPVYVVPLEIMKRIAGFNIHRGVLAVGFRSAVERSGLDPDLPHREALTLLLCENITNIDNMGFLFRNAGAFGVDAVLLSPRCHDPLYRKSLRVSIGHALTVPFVRLDPRAVDLDAVDRPARVGLVVGQEYEGISPDTLDRCDPIVRIPMAPGVDSLNVAVAAAVCLHRFSRGRRS
jgi:tRNA G18 (ribose-2'-O)-methylase SpoU